MKTKDRSPESPSNSLRRVLPWVVVGALVLGVFAVMPSVWALPQQAPDFQTLPTLTAYPSGWCNRYAYPSGWCNRHAYPSDRRNSHAHSVRRADRYPSTWRYSDRNTWRRHADRNAWRRHTDRHGFRRVNRFRDTHPIGNRPGTHWAERLLDSAYAWF